MYLTHNSTLSIYMSSTGGTGRWRCYWRLTRRWWASSRPTAPCSTPTPRSTSPPGTDTTMSSNSLSRYFEMQTFVFPPFDLRPVLHFCAKLIMDQKQIDSAQKKQAEDMASVPTNNDFFLSRYHF